LLSLVMPETHPQDLTRTVVAQAKALGADLAGIASWQALMAGPSYKIQPFLPTWGGVGAGHPGRPPEPEGPAQPRSVIVLGVAHPTKKPEMDWWRNDLPSRTLGNVELARVAGGLAAWLEEAHGVTAWDLAYHVERGGVFLKDAAVLAGLGVVGRNNLFLAPGLGPRVRLRAVAVGEALASTPASDYDPCDGCDEPCRAACPRDALAGQALAPEALERAGSAALEQLPARDGSYERQICNRQMEADIAAGRVITPADGGRSYKEVRYCRRCEIACPAGRKR
jgi:epoxyqueuosine reductase